MFGWPVMLKSSIVVGVIGKLNDGALRYCMALGREKIISSCAC